MSDEFCGSINPEDPDQHCGLERDNHRFCYSIETGEHWENPNWRLKESSKAMLAPKAKEAREHLAAREPPKPDRTVRSASAPKVDEAMPGYVRADHPETSINAAWMNQRARGGQRAQILAAFAANPEGLTDEEAAHVAGIRVESSPHRRCGELREWGFLEATGKVRPTTSGAEAQVWRITADGAAAWRDWESSDD